MKRAVFFLVILGMAGFLFLSSCAQNEPVVSASPAPSETASPLPSASPEPSAEPEPTPTPEPVNRNPLTGLEMNPDYLNRRPVAIMINNIKQALPQYGISKADIIYEVVAEGGITRMVAVMQDPSLADVVGSVRSTRSYYLDLAQGLDALLLHAGASEYAYNDIKTRGVTSLDAIRGGYEGPLYYRDQSRIKNNGLEHSLMTTGERIVKIIDQASFRTEHKEGYSYPVHFDPALTLDGDAATDVTVRMSQYKTGEFEYNEETEHYLVYQYGKKHMDAGADTQLEMKNVLILYADITSIKGDSYGRMAVDLVGSGEGLYLCEGKAVDIRWSKDSYDAPFVYTNPDGSERIFHSGTSYISIVSSAKAVTLK